MSSGRKRPADNDDDDENTAKRHAAGSQMPDSSLLHSLSSVASTLPAADDVPPPVRTAVRAPLESGRIYHDSHTRVFTLVGRTSSYVFRVDDRGWLEHLYWGAKLNDAGDDLSYLVASNSIMPLDPKPLSLLEESTWSSKPVSHLQGASINQLTATWRHSTHMKNSNVHDTRVENASWRLMHMQRKARTSPLSPALSSVSSSSSSSSALSSAFSPTSPDTSQAPTSGTPRMDLDVFLNDTARDLQRALTRKASASSSTASSDEAPSSPPATAASARSRRDVPVLPVIESFHSSKSSKLLEFSELGPLDLRSESFHAEHHDHDDAESLQSGCVLVYSGHRIVAGKPAIPNALPSLYALPGDDCTTLIIALVDPDTLLEVSLYYTVYAQYDVVCRRVVVSNNGAAPATLLRIMSCTLDFDTDDNYVVTQLAGAWGREHHVVSRPLTAPGRTSFESLGGISGHTHSPLAAVSRGPPREDSGEVFGFCLLYGGNWLADFELTDTRRLRVNMGIHPQSFAQLLSTGSGGGGQSFYTPEALLCYSAADGLGGLSLDLHRVFRERLTPQRWQAAPLPVHISTWQIGQLSITEDRVLSLAQRAAPLGVELLVLDETWYRSSVAQLGMSGTWTADPARFPSGLPALAQRVREIGLQFGLWIAPEVTYHESPLHSAHPDWCFPVDRFQLRRPSSSLVLIDFSLPAVQNYTFDHVSALIDATQLAYLKWGVSRTPCPPCSSVSTSQFHAHLLGVYATLRRLHERHPRVVFDVTPGFGGRVDPALLALSACSSISDNNDPAARILSQYGSSLCLPPSTFANRIQAVPNLLSNRWSTLKLRALVAMCGAFGIELDLGHSSDETLSVLRYYIALRKRFAALVHTGCFYRLWSPFDTDSCAWMFVCKSRRAALVFVFNLHYQLARREPRLRLRGLADSLVYRVNEICPGNLRLDLSLAALETDRQKPVFHNQYGTTSLALSGRALMHAGLPIKFDYEGDSALFHIIAQKPIE